MQRTPTTTRGRQTFEAILQGAVACFVEKGYHATSVSEICRQAGIANGSFYQYFPDKVDAFNELVNRISQAFLQALDGAAELETVVERLFDFFDTHGRSFQIFREAEFLDVPHPLRTFYGIAIPSLQASLNTNEPEAWAFLGGITMVALFYGVWPAKRIPAEIRRAFLDVASQGIAPPDRQPLPMMVLQPRLANAGGDEPLGGRAERTRALLIQAARVCFARQGYANTHIAHITQTAETALGTFYVHFPEKREILATLTAQIREEMQAEVIHACRGLTHRLDVERGAFATFLEYLLGHHEIYRIVREAEFAEPEIGYAYYREIWKRWSELIGEAMKKKQIRQGHPGVSAAFLMGGESHVGMRWILWEPSHVPPPGVVQSSWQFLCHGWNGRKRSVGRLPSVDRS